MRRQNNEWGKLDNRKVWQKVWKMKRSRNRLERHMICNLKPTFQGKELLFHCKISTPIEKYSPRIALVKSAQKIDISRAAIAQWIYLFLPFWGPRFESDHAFSIYSQILYYICLCIMKRGQKYTKRVWFIFKINRLVKIECTLTQSACFICSVAYYQPTYLPTYLLTYIPTASKSWWWYVGPMFGFALICWENTHQLFVERGVSDPVLVHLLSTEVLHAIIIPAQICITSNL